MIALPLIISAEIICPVFTGVQSSKLNLQIDGAPNTRSVPGQNVFGSAMPTVEGIRNVLHHVACDPTSSQSDQQVSYRGMLKKE